MAEKITPRAADYPQWYLDIVKQAQLADNSDVRKAFQQTAHEALAK